MLSDSYPFCLLTAVFRKLKLLWALAALACCLPAQAQVYDTTHRYMGVLERKAEAGAYYDVLAEVEALQKRFTGWAGGYGTQGRAQYLARNYAAARQAYAAEREDLQTPPAQHLLDAADCAYRLAEFDEAAALLARMASRAELKAQPALKGRYNLLGQHLAARIDVLDTLGQYFGMDTTFRFPNSGYADFAAIPAGKGGQVLFASLRADSVRHLGPTDPVFDVTTLYRYTPGGAQADGFTRLEALRGLAPAGCQVGNPALAPDGRSLFYSVCRPTAGGSLYCRIYMAELDTKGRVIKSRPVAGGVNAAGSNTQPCAVPAAKGKGLGGLYFASDRKGTRGGTDLFFAAYDAKKQTFGPAAPVGKVVNTAGNEGWPFWHAPSGRLFFSSDGHPGFGGQDVFVATGQARAFEAVTNLGQPLNSAADDHSFCPEGEAAEAGFLASNRAGATLLQDVYCCEDIFRWQTLPRPVRRPGLLAARKQAAEQAERRRQDSLSAAAAARAAALQAALEVTRQRRQDSLLAARAAAAKLRKDTVTFRRADLARNESSAPVASVALQAKRISQGIRFELGSAQLLDESKAGLDTLAQILQQHPRWRLTLTGHTDNKGKPAANHKLGLARAQSVVAYLAAAGADAARLRAKSLGATRPAFPNNTDANRARNRRVTATFAER